MNVLLTGAGAITETPPDAARDRDPDWFDPAEHLGRRGWKYFGPATRYLLAAGHQALGRRHDDPPLDGDPSLRLGVVTGTQYAIARAHRRMDDTLRAEGVRAISPAEVPAFSMSTPGSQLAISTGARAFSVTLTNPVTAGLEAVHFALTALRTGRADRVVAAATDQAPDGDEGRGGLDGAAAVVLSSPEAAGRAGALAEITGGLSRFLPRGADGHRDPAALAAAGVRVAALAAGARDVRLVVGAPSGAAPLAAAVLGAVATAIAGSGGSLCPSGGQFAEARHCTASGLLELTALARAGGTALVVSLSDSGHLTAIALRSPGELGFHRSSAN